MTASGRIDFWYEFASTYSYPAAMRIETLARNRNICVRWRPFLLGPLFAAQGWRDSPFNIYPAKGRYMWRDLARICARENIPLVLPPFRFPQNGLKAARLSLAGHDEGWIGEFTRSVYRANFAEQKDISDEIVLRDILQAVTGRADEIMPRSESADVKSALKLQTEEAQALGIFGAPSFTVDDELFWGNDRLEEALSFAASRAE